MTYHIIWVSIYGINTFENCLKWFVYINTLLPCIAWVRMERFSRFLRILVTTMYFKDRNLISKTVYCKRCLMVCKNNCSLRISDILDKAGRKTRKRNNTGNCKALCVSCKRNKEFSYMLILFLLKLHDASTSSSCKHNDAIFFNAEILLNFSQIFTMEITWSWNQKIILCNNFWTCFYLR